MALPDVRFKIAAEDETAAAFASAREQVQATGKAVQLNAMQVQNMSYQMQDLAQGLLTGQSPFRLIVQQGSQIAQIFRPGTGLPAALKETGTAVRTFLLNPLNLAVVGFAVAGAAASAAFGLIKGGAEDTTKLLADHKKLIDEIGKEWDTAGSFVEAYNRRSRTALSFDLRQQQGKLEAAYKAEIENILLIQPLVERFADNIGPAASAFLRFADAARGGTENVNAFHEEIQALANADPANEFLQKFAGQLLDLTQKAGDFEKALRGAADASAEMFRKTSAATPLTGSRQQMERASMEAYYAELGFGGGFVLGDVVDTKTTSKKKDATANAIKSVTENLAFQQAQLTRTAREQFVYNQLQRAGIAANHSAAPAIMAAAGALYDQESALKKTIDAMDAVRDVARDVFGSFVSDLKQGKTLVESLGGALDRLGSRILDSGLDQLVAGLFGARGTTQTGSFGGNLIGSLVGGLFGFDSGTDFVVGGAGGPDSKFFPMALTPGERVRVTKPGQKGGEVTTINVNVAVNGARGDREIRALVEQGVASGLAQAEKERPRAQLKYG